MVAKRDFTPLIGKVFGRLVVKEVYRDGVYVKAVCECSCGTLKSIRVSSLEDGYSSSCGCYAKEAASARVSTHGFSNHRLFGVWEGMDRRCYDPNRNDYHHYGGRGITVCERWKRRFDGVEDGFKNFVEDMEDSFEEGLEIDREDVDGNYEPSNCRWVTRRIQVINRRPTGSQFDTKMIEYQGKTLCLSQWADEVGIPSKVLVDRLGKLKWSVERAFTEVMKPRQIYVFHREHRFELKDIFKAPPNHFYKARKIGITGYQYFANLFRGLFEVKILVAGELHDVEPDQSVVESANLNITQTFTKYCEDNKIPLVVNESVV